MICITLKYSYSIFNYRQIDEEKLKYGKQKDTFLFNIKKLEEEKEKSTRLLTMSYEQEKRIIVTEKNQLQETIRILKNEKKKLQEDLADTKYKDLIRNSYCGEKPLQIKLNRWNLNEKISSLSIVYIDVNLKSHIPVHSLAHSIPK